MRRDRPEKDRSDVGLSSRRRKRRAMALLEEGAAIATILLASTITARADCLPNPPTNGATVTCTGPAVTTTPVNAPGVSNVTVNINSDAEIEGVGPLINLGSGAQITNNGTVSVISSGAGAIGIRAAEGSVIRNFGTIDASGFNALSAASTGDNVLMSNEVGGQINISGDLAAGLLIGGGNDSALLNAGTITLNTFQGGGLFIQEGSGHTATNAVTGVIDSSLDQAFGMNAQKGVAAGAGRDITLFNAGTIITRGEASHGMILNDLSNSSAVNTGTITTSGGASETLNRAFGMFSFGGQSNILANGASGVINASGIGSSGMEVVDGDGNMLTNQGQINVSGTGAHGMQIDSGAGNTLDNGGTLNVSGTRGNGLRVDDGGNTVINSGNIQVGGSSSFGVFMQGNGNTLTNSGTIHATGNNSDGVLSNTLGGSFTSTIRNTGSIISDTRFAVRGVNGQEMLINSGQISSGAGTAIDLRAGNDTLVLQTGSTINGLADGGNGNDDVILEGTGTATNDFQNFETLRMTGTDWTWLGNGTFDDGRIESGILRVNGVLTSPLTVDAGTTLGGDGTVVGNVFSKGTIAPGNSIGVLTIAGDYTSDGGTLLIEAELGDDGSPSDKLVIDGGGTSGVTPMQVVNLGGAGALTTANGIPVVEAVGGGTTSTDAFALAAPVAAGPYEYLLFRGGITAGSEENWYLRSTLPPTSPPGSPTPEPAPGIPLPGPGVAPPTPGATPVVGDLVPLYRFAVPTYAVISPLAHHVATSTLGTFHERRGEQILLDDTGDLSSTWARVFGEHVEAKWDGTVSPSFDGNLFGVQAGVDLLDWDSGAGQDDRAGIFFGHARMNGGVKGQAFGWNDLQVGQARLSATSLGAYWTHIGPSGWYLDGVIMGSWFGGDATTDTGDSIDIEGTGTTISLEGGFPFELASGWTIEPQGQIIWQRLSLDEQSDAFSTVRFGTHDAVTARLGVRMHGDFEAQGRRYLPYLKVNIWHEPDSDEHIFFDGTPITTGIGGTSVEIGGGLVTELSETLSLYATADYRFDVDGGNRRAIDGSIGVSMKW